MEEEIQDFNNTLLSLYFNNLEFLKKEFPEVFEKVNDLSEKINNNQYTEKYTLDYNEEGYFDIFDIEKNDFIYGFNSYEEADKRKDLVDFSKNYTINLLRVDDTNESLALMHSLGAALPLVNFLNNTIDFKKITFSKVFKFIFVGVGVGVHIHEIYKKINSMNTLIIEPNLEIFRLSLFTIDYSEFNKDNKKLFLSIGENELERESTINLFNAYHSYMNYSVKHHLFWEDYKYIIDHLIAYYSRNYSAAFPYSTVLTVFGRMIQFMKKGFKYLQYEAVKEKKILKGKRVLHVGAGPSLDQQIDWIKENQNKFVIVLVDNMVKKFESYGIIPDIVVSIDPGAVVANFYKTKNEDFLKNSSLVFLAQQHNDVIEEVKDLNFFFTQPYPISDELKLSFSLPNVGTYGYALALLLGCKELYLVGSDSALAEDGTIYASHAENDTRGHEGKQNISSDNISPSDLIEVKGNLSDCVKSTRKIIGYKHDYESFIHSYKEKDYKAYNLSTGAYIEGLIPKRIEDVEVDTFETIEKNTLPLLESVSTTVKKLDFKNDRKIISSIILRVEKFKKVKINSKDDLLQKKLDLMIWILEQKKKMDYSIFGNIFLQFTDLIDIYINFSLNLTQKELQEKEFLSKVKMYWANALIDLLKNLKSVTKVDDEK